MYISSIEFLDLSRSPDERRTNQKIALNKKSQEEEAADGLYQKYKVCRLLIPLKGHKSG